MPNWNLLQSLAVL